MYIWKGYNKNLYRRINYHHVNNITFLYILITLYIIVWSCALLLLCVLLDMHIVANILYLLMLRLPQIALYLFDVILVIYLIFIIFLNFISLALKIAISLSTN